MTNRIGGDYSAEALEAFRAAYAAQMQTPEDLDTAPNGLPGNEISNTSPWIAHTGLWKANDGMSRDFKPNEPFNPSAFITEEEEEEMSEEELDASLTHEELMALSQELGAEDEVSEEDEGVSEDEIDALINEILSSDED